MIDFTNIRVEGDFIYADAENLSYNIKVSNGDTLS